MPFPNTCRLGEVAPVAVTFTCPQCDRTLRLSTPAPGRVVRCPACGAQFRPPAVETAVPVLEPEEESFPEPEALTDRPTAVRRAARPADSADALPARSVARPPRKRGSGTGGLIAVIGAVAALAVATTVGGVAYLVTSGAVKKAFSGAAAVSPQAWAPFSSADGRYTVQLPGTPTAANVTTNGVTITRQVLTLQNGQIMFAIGYFDVPAGLMTPELLTKATTAERDMMLTMTRGKTISEREVVADSRPAHEFQIQAPTSAVLIERISKARLGAVDRVYVLVAQGPNYTPDSGDAAHFFNSFTVDSAAAEPAAPPGPPKPPPPPKPAPKLN